MWVRMSFAVIGSFIVRVWDCLFWLYLWWKIMHLLGFKLTVKRCRAGDIWEIFCVADELYSSLFTLPQNTSAPSSPPCWEISSPSREAGSSASSRRTTVRRFVSSSSCWFLHYSSCLAPRFVLHLMFLSASSDFCCLHCQLCFSFRAGVLCFMNLNALKIYFLKLLCTLCNRNALINIRSR